MDIDGIEVVRAKQEIRDIRGMCEQLYTFYEHYFKCFDSIEEGELSPVHCKNPGEYYKDIVNHGFKIDGCVFKIIPRNTQVTLNSLENIRRFLQENKEKKEDVKLFAKRMRSICRMNMQRFKFLRKYGPEVYSFSEDCVFEEEPDEESIAPMIETGLWGDLRNPVINHWAGVNDLMGSLTHSWRLNSEVIHHASQDIITITKQGTPYGTSHFKDQDKEVRNYEG